LVISRY